jgi:methyl-accepting chemotaxis protein
MSTGSLVEDMHTINEQMGSSKETVESLKAEADVFKKF